MLSEINRVSARKGVEPRKWTRNLIRIVAEYRAEGADASLTAPFVVAILLAFVSGTVMFVAFSQLGSSPQ
jgi:hypothetical protein